MSPPPATGSPRPWARGVVRVGRAVLAAGVLLCAAGQAVPALVHLRGDRLLVVVSGSMAPTFRAGDVVVVRDPRASELRPGMVVAFHAPGSPQRLTTHRIRSLRPRPSGLFLQTQGDANRTPDPDFTPAAAVVGVMGGHVPHAGVWLSRLQSPGVRLVLLGLPLLALVLAQAWALWGAHGGGRLLSRGAAGAIVAGLVVGAAAVVPGTRATFTASASVGANAFATTSFCASASTYASTILAGAPDRLYRLGEASGTTAVDASGTADNGTYRNAPTLGRPGAIKCDTSTAVGFDGATEYVSTAKQVTNPATFTLEAWFRTAVGGGRIIGFGDATTGASTTADRHIYLTDAGQVVFGVNPTTKKVVTSPLTYLDDRWHLVDATLGATGMRLYVDGALVASDAATTTTTSYKGYWRLAYDVLTGWPGAPSRPYFTGLLDEVGISATALTAAQVSAHFAANHP